MSEVCMPVWIFLMYALSGMVAWVILGSWLTGKLIASYRKSTPNSQKAQGSQERE